MTNTCSTTQKSVRGCILAVLYLGLVACDTGPSQIMGASQSLTAIAGVQRAANAEPSETDLALTCAGIASELSSLYAQLSEIDRQQRVVQRKRNIQNGMINTGISVLGADALANAGSVNGIRNTGAAMGAAGAVANGARSAGTPEDGQVLNRALALQERAALLERVKVRKGC